MGLDVYLGGYDAYSKRIADAHEKFEAACAARDKLADGPQKEKAQEEVERWADEMWAGKNGYLRSSYNGSGTFTVLREIFGFDVAGYLFPGDWDAPDYSIDGEEFLHKTTLLALTVTTALEQKRTALPWLTLFKQISRETPPDHNERIDKMLGFVQGIVARIKDETDFGVDSEPPRSDTVLSERHTWYITKGLLNIMQFGRLAASLGRSIPVTMSY